MEEDGQQEKAMSVPEVSELEQHMLERHLRNQLMEALALLPDIQRETMLLHYLYGLKYHE